jgi:hypothetical protein
LKKKINTDLDDVEFNNTIPVKRLLHFIRQEKNGFLSEITPHDLNRIILVKPKQNNKRIIAQAGAFFAFGLTNEIQDSNSDNIRITRIPIAASAKANILAHLDKLGVNEKTMFPEIERAARYITGSLSTADITSRLLKLSTLT